MSDHLITIRQYFFTINMTLVEREGPVDRKLNYLFGELQMPGRRGGAQNLYFGWGTDNLPIVTSDKSALSRSALDTESDDTPKEFPYNATRARFAPQALEFEVISQPIDNEDRGRQFTEDVVNIACTNHNGAIKFLEIGELTLLESIINGQVEWQSGEPSYSLVIPDDVNETLNILLFSPSGEFTNELNYRTFLLQVIRTLATIDRKQRPPDQKGYMDVVRAVVEELENRAHQNQPTGGMLKKIATDFGILNEATPSCSQELAYLSVDQLRYVITKAFEVVSQSFAEGKN